MLDKLNGCDPNVWAVLIIAMGIVLVVCSPRCHDTAVALITLGGGLFQGRRSAGGAGGAAGN